MAKIDFTVYEGGLKWTIDGVQKGTSRGFTWADVYALVSTPVGVSLANVRESADATWEEHSVDGVDSTDYHDFQDKLTAAGFTM